MIERMPNQIRELNRLIRGNHYDCLDNLRVDRNAFGRLCIILQNRGGLVDGKHVSIEEQISMFLGILVHHKKNGVVRYTYNRSGQTVSHYVHLVLTAILQLDSILLVRHVPVPDDSTNHRCKWFKGCLGALDGTFVNIRVPAIDIGRYRTRKGQIATNVLAVCDTDLRFVYVLPGWEGSASDVRILRDSINRPHGLKVPVGNYYLCDNGYANSVGFMAPYRGVRYHLKEWGPATAQPANPQEHFNMRHTKARNVIERAFGIMKMRWGILRSSSFYPIQTQIRLIMTCFLLHNFIRLEMEVDQMEILYNATPSPQHEEPEDDVDYIGTVEATNEWTMIKDLLAQELMAANEGPCPDRGSFKKPTSNTRRIWTTHEEKVLINMLKELVNKGYKSDNYFRTCYLIKCEEALKEDFPKMNLQASPHITSKLIAWKKSYSSLVTTHTTTGVGFNTTTSQLECTDDQWESVVKKDPLMRDMRYKEWSYFLDWVDIFGLDGATGSVAEDMVEMAKRLKCMYGKSQPVVENHEHDGANYKSGGNDPTEGNSTAHEASNIARDTTNGARNKKSSESNEPSNMERLLGELCHTTGVVPGLSIKDKLKASVLIGGKVEYLQIWSTPPDEAQVIYVNEVLGVKDVD
ncbi:hypothetical protein ACS0TY_023846 [Phlomoides rotata]